MKFKFSLNQKTFLYIFYGIIAVLFVIKLIFPQITREKNEIQQRQNVTAEKANDSIYAQSLVVDSINTLLLNIMPTESLNTTGFTVFLIL